MSNIPEQYAKIAISAIQFLILVIWRVYDRLNNGWNCKIEKIAIFMKNFDLFYGIFAWKAGHFDFILSY